MDSEWNEKNDKLKEIKTDTRQWRENKRFRIDETVINRLRTGHTLLNLGYLMEGLPVLECDLCHSHTMTVKHHLTDYANPDTLRLRFLTVPTQKR